MTRTVRIRGMNAAAAAAVPEERYPHSSVRQLVVAVAVLATGAVVAWYTVTQVGSRSAFAGIVQPEQSMDLDFVQIGRVTQILVKPGDHVVKGQPLAIQDTAAATAAVKNAQAVLDAKKARVTALQAPILPDSVKRSLDLQVEKANIQLSGAQKMVKDATSKGDADVAQARAAVTKAQSTLDTDTARYRSDCTGETVPRYCPELQMQIQQDTAAVGTAAAALAGKEANAARAQDAANTAVATARTTLAMAQNQQSTAAVSATAADIAAAQADVSAAQAAVDQAQSGLDALTLVAPMAGTVVNVGGIAGELDGPNGVRTFSGPQAVEAGDGPAFSLFPPADGSSATKNPGDDTQPLLSLATSGFHVIAQVGEEAVARIRQGDLARITVNTSKEVVDGTVQSIIPVPVNQGGSVSYHVRLAVHDWPDGTVPGMSLSVEFP
ncbi:HlyD family efflux transporter periplasmic adaptor subunit [Actinocrispum sp. NPDC049592]|uniref:HlyD family secretion protein n=1 Tax=Actinocrispum sp. NPDC049592 TaxID=3154835 RepID=UPI003435C5EC